MRVCVLGSGSKGNVTYFSTSHHHYLIDLGTTSLYAVKKLAEIGVTPAEIDGIFITHTHVDHISGLRVFLKKYHPKIYLTKGIYQELSKELELSSYVLLSDTFYMDELQVEMIKTSHDAPDSVGYIFTSSDQSLVYITDTGYIHQKYYDLLKNHDIYILESNHDVKMLMDGTYPYHLKQRIVGDYGHLSNQACSDYLDVFIGDRTKYVFLAHLSEHNNTPLLAYHEAKVIMEKHHENEEALIVASQNNRTELIEI